MSLNKVPSKNEVMGWNPQSLADYMRRLNLSGCDKAVMKGSISGAKFLQMTEGDLQVFPSLSVSIITKIQSDISKGDQKKGFGHKSKVQKFPKQAFVQEEVWDSDEFDNESDHDDEGPHQEEGREGYICALTEQQDSEEASEEEYEMPCSDDNMTPPRPPRVTKLLDDPGRDVSPAERTLRPPLPLPPKTNNAPQRPSKAPAGKPSLTFDRSKKPTSSGQPRKDLKKSKGSPTKAPSSSTSKALKVRPPKPTDVPKRTSKLIPTPQVPTKPVRDNSSTPELRQCIKDLDPSWYGGKVTRHQAEAALREVNKDGAFIVRDSSKASDEHPYTLMLLKQEKVFNIMIRNLGNSYSLGTGLKNNKSFPGVKEMITHHTYTPLMLIDATDHSSEAQNQCCLLHPAGL
uniref:lymphocyte cytosolic protein 2 n=1 Tax=Semicossyphus pulcher TaxID=241346 RepID=UPI0037E96646